MKTFARNLAELMPDWVKLSPEIIETFDWIEDQGWYKVRRNGAPEDKVLLIYPPELQNHPLASHVAFAGTTLPYTSHWSTPDPAIDRRIFEFGETSGDGGRVAIWLDEAGKQQFVHIGHDSLGIIADDPLILMQFLAMGYPEPGALDQTDISPMQAYLEYHGVPSLADFGKEDQPVLPLDLQGYLKDRFDIDMPETAADIGIRRFAGYHDPDTTDPFARWIATVTPEPDEKDLAYELELMRRIESLDLKDDDTSQAIMDKIGTLFNSKD
ncbi:hypothetical protein OS189_06555 [Sulfitobacter sp. F26169L]|uniref:hypothetical protein n=1 Tax=Sulfitobacter sp. F26169L TaxID=2996015 RepID=UPI0022609DC6|nr:hypothetical protein [Sulfitobacter sp. F26169L]MCX7566000.1 hypothetical protein [Sulfitobacter sp. F26169L]